jgi:hypothetical protein
LEILTRRLSKRELEDAYAEQHGVEPKNHINLPVSG